MMVAKWLRANKLTRSWFHRGGRKHDAPWQPSRLSQFRLGIRKGLRGMGNLLPSAPAWIAQPVSRAEIHSYGRWRWLRIGYWKTCARYYIGRCFCNPYGRVTASITALITVVSGLLIVGAVYGGLTYGVNSRTLSQRSAYQAAVVRGDLDSASVALHSLREAAPQNQEYRYQQSLLELKRGETSAARKTMRSLVEDNQHASAAAWLLVNDFELSNVAQWGGAQHAEFRSLAELLMSHSDPAVSSDAKLRMASYLVAAGATSDALRLLTDLSDEHPPAALVAATLCLRQGKLADARAHAEVAKAYFAQELKARANDTKVRLDLARALIVLSQEEQALRELSDGFQLTEDPLLRRASAEAMVIWAGRLGDQAEQTDQILLQRLQLLHRASQCAPQDPQISAAIIELVLECKDNKHAQVATLRKATAQGIDPESVHFARGTLALLEGRADEAQTHLNQAAQRGTQLPATLNNMAMAIYHSSDGDLEQALKLADKACELVPAHPYLHDTRGRILLKLKRYPEAIESLEKGLLAPELQTEIYSNLATAYRQLGDVAMAHEMESLLVQDTASH